jgi:hypothetical protein
MDTRPVAHVYRLPIGPDVYTITRADDGFTTAEHFHAATDDSYPANFLTDYPDDGHNTIVCTECGHGAILRRRSV